MLTFGTVASGSDFAVGTLENPTWFHLAAGLVVYKAACMLSVLVQRVFHWEPSTKLREGMEKTYRWIYDQMVAREAVHSSV